MVDRLGPATPRPASWPQQVGLGSNLLAHHLRVLEDAGVMRRVRSEGDRRRSYVQLRLDNPIVLVRRPGQRLTDRLAGRRAAGGVRVHRELGPIPAGGGHGGTR